MEKIIEVPLKDKVLTGKIVVELYNNLRDSLTYTLYASKKIVSSDKKTINWQPVKIEGDGHYDSIESIISALPRFEKTLVDNLKVEAKKTDNLNKLTAYGFS